jgi:aryl-alcohol dehydrogenase-like predicted oxidoreductase
LATGHIALYQFHNNGCPAEQAAEVRDTLEALVTEGKIRAYGWSTDYKDRATFFAQGEKCATIQLQMNVLKTNPALLGVCE